MQLSRFLFAGTILVTAMLNAAATHADEGMWLFNAPPLKALKEKYNFEPTAQWLDHVQKSSIRFNSGGSGSFVSPNGLVMTNHHVGADDLQKLSTPEKNYLNDGFHARTLDQELKCKGLELNVLQSIKIVTDEVNGAVKPEMSAEDAFKARQAKIAALETASADDANGIRADVVTLFNGGQYHLYTFKKYTDIRLVFAPEKAIAFFGGDPDNFEYPRYCLDVCFFRVYENDAPLKCDNYLKWSANGSKAGELIFVSGHPGRTTRAAILPELEYLRDKGFPDLLDRINRLEVTLAAWTSRSAANAQKGEDYLFGIQNSRKARRGGLGGLLNPKILARKNLDEERLKKFIDERLEYSTKPEERQQLLDAKKAFDTIAKAEKERARLATDMSQLESGIAFNTDLFGFARTLYRAAQEKPKPSGERLPEYADAKLPGLEFRLFTDAPVYDDFEVVKLTDSLTAFATTYGYNDPLVQKVLAGKSPSERAYELISESRLQNPKIREKFYEGGTELIDKAYDPMLELVKMIDEKARAVRKEYEAKVDEPKREAYAALAKVRYMMDGDKTYPDATFTLRLAYGTVKGFTEQGVNVPAYTKMGGLYKRAAEQGNVYPFKLPERWIERKDKLDLSTPFNFVSTADIIGGNSGSPVINKEGEVVGLIFDGNIQSLVLDFIYEDDIARAVSVDSRAIIEALDTMYDAKELLAELGK